MSKTSWRHTNADMARDIKRLVWEGHTQARVAKHFGLSQGTINRIVNGLDFEDVPWPDGSTGELAQKRKRMMTALRHGTLPPITEGIS